jgi:hypothetical protein
MTVAVSTSTRPRIHAGRHSYSGIPRRACPLPELTGFLHRMYGYVKCIYGVRAHQRPHLLP